VVVYQGNSKRGHYVASLKPAAGPHWVLFDDHEVITILDDDQGRMRSPSSKMREEQDEQKGQVEELIPPNSPMDGAPQRQNTGDD